MTEMTKYPPGAFSWDELATSDGSAAKKFYTTLFGWKANESPMGPDQPPYVMLEKGSKPVAALYENKKTRPHWNSYVSVSNVDDAAKKAKSLGAKILAEPFDVMDVGRMATIQDPYGAVLSLWQPKKHIGAHILGEPGALVWTELMTTDAKSAESFHTRLFPWKTSQMQSATGGPYTSFLVGENGTGGMMQITPEMGKMPAHWYPYFAVDDCDATVAKAKGLGAQVHVPATDIPNVGRFAVLSDPQGAPFAVIKTQPM